jgi:hypothetical protein
LARIAAASSAEALRTGKAVRLQHAWGTTELQQGDLGGFVVRAHLLTEGDTPLSAARLLEQKRRQMETGGPLKADQLRELAGYALLLGERSACDKLLGEAAQLDAMHPAAAAKRQTVALAGRVPDNPHVATWRTPACGWKTTR